MSDKRIIIDALWRCLCPSFDIAKLGTTVARPTRSRRPTAAPRRAPPCMVASGRRAAATWTYNPDRLRAEEDRGKAAELGQGETRVDRNDVRPGLRPLIRRIGKRTEGDVDAPTVVRARDLPAAAQAASTPVLYEALESLPRYEGTGQKMVFLAKHLLEQRGERPNAQLYESIAKANWDTAGSAESVKQMLRDMQENGVDKSPGLYHAALQVLAIHPDYRLRNHILNDMASRWVDVSHQGRYSIALGLLRDGQYELALEQLEKLSGEGIPIPAWLYDVYIYALGQLGFLDEAIRILYHRLESSEKEPISLNVWYFLLDECSKRLHYNGTKSVWDRMVKQGMLNPSDGIALNVLNTAARHNDPDLAALALDHISSKGTKLGLHHYEALVDCYAYADDVKNALKTLCIMEEAKVPTTRDSTRAIFLLLKRSPGLHGAAIEGLLELRKSYDVPMPAFNVVVEALVARGDMHAALDLYQQVREICRAAPTVETFELLLANCRQSAIADFLASEMSAFSIQPTRSVYDRLVYIHAEDGDLDTAFRYLWEMGSRAARAGSAKTHETYISKETSTALVKRCVMEGDDRITDVVDNTMKRGVRIQGEVHEALINLGDHLSPSSD